MSTVTTTDFPPVKSKDQPSHSLIDASGQRPGTETFAGIGTDRCWDWSPPFSAVTKPLPLTFGPDTCAPPFVWREAEPADHVCVPVEERARVAAENGLANQRRAVPR
jgi:hypothetical protein